MTVPNGQTTTSTGRYSTWLGQPVALWVAAGNVRTTLHCAIVGESDAAVRVRIAGIWDVDIYKEMVLAVEAVQPALRNDDADSEALKDLTRRSTEL